MQTTNFATEVNNHNAKLASLTPQEFTEYFWSNYFSYFLEGSFFQKKSSGRLFLGL